MGEHGGRSGFAPKTLAMDRIARQLRRQHFDRHGPAELVVSGQIDPTHAAAAQLAHDRIGADHGARLERAVFFEKVRRRLHQRLREKRAGSRMVIQQRSHFGAHIPIVRLRALEPARDVHGIHVERGLKEIARAAMLIRSHVLSSRKSQARARAQRRFSVAGDMPMASAASSTLMPAK